jgi:hypothetical protein
VEAFHSEPVYAWDFDVEQRSGKHKRLSEVHAHHVRHAPCQRAQHLRQQRAQSSKHFGLRARCGETYFLSPSSGLLAK